MSAGRKAIPQRACRAAGWLAVCSVMTFAAGCSLMRDKNPNERTTGDGGKLLRVSSTQVTVDPSASELATLARVQDRTFMQPGNDRLLAASTAALKEMGFNPVKADPQTALVEGQLDRVLKERWRAAIRALFKARGVPLSAKPDHESVAALVAVRSNAAGGTLVRARFNVTIWDSNGDSRTTTVTDAEMYDRFFARLDEVIASAR